MNRLISLRPDYGHLPGLDGLRACAVLMVLVAHLGFHQYVPGGFGVTLFFFISGMLISRLLLAEQVRAGRIDLMKFYVRRFLRLYPALVLAVALHVVIYPVLGGVVTWPEIAAALLYYANYFNQMVGFGSAGVATFGAFHPLGVQWSLAIEEQYYIIFPLLMILVGVKWPRLLSLFVGVALVCLVWRCYAQAIGWGGRNYSSTDTRMDSIIYGAVLTILLASEYGQMVKRFLLQSWVLIGAVAALLSTFLIRDEAFRNTLRYTIQGVALMPLVCWIVFDAGRGRVHTMLSCKPMVYLGAWSYSLYLFHGHAVLISENLFKVSYMSGPSALPLGFYPVVLTLTFAFALTSYYGVEQRFLKLRSRFGSHAIGT